MWVSLCYSILKGVLSTYDLLGGNVACPRPAADIRPVGLSWLSPTLTNQETPLYRVQLDVSIGINIQHNNRFIDRIAVRPQRNLTAHPLDRLRAFDLCQGLLNIGEREALLRRKYRITCTQ